MRIVICGNKSAWNEWSEAISAPGDLEVIYAAKLEDLITFEGLDAVFVLTNEDALPKELPECHIPIFLNSVSATSSELNLPSNFVRINGWPTFIKRNCWEIVPIGNTSFNSILNHLGLGYIAVNDETGMITAKVVSMIINEAYFALDEGISTKKEIDTAMKLGTNYPYGPFEWAEIIGVENIYRLLNKLSKIDTRYTPAAGLKTDMESKLF